MSVAAEATLKLLLFSVGGVRFGCDAEQAEKVATYGGQAADDLFWFHQELGYGGVSVVYRAPSIVTVRTEDARSYRVIIDMMEEFIEVTADDICPFPRFMEPFFLRKGMWGVVQRGGGMILLLDFQRFLRDKCGWGDPACQGG
jgi:chemotaxis signal transduction protein